MKNLFVRKMICKYYSTRYSSYNINIDFWKCNLILE